VPDLVTPKEIQAWGRWASDSYKAYTKLSHLGRQQIFEKYRICCSQNPRNNIWEKYNNSDCILGPFYPPTSMLPDYIRFSTNNPYVYMQACRRRWGRRPSKRR
jgi:hypothetical protein